MGLQFQLKPDTVKDQCFTMHHAMKGNEEQVIDNMYLSYVEKVDGKVPNVDELPIGTAAWLNETLKDEADKIRELSEVKVKCDQCDVDKTFQINIYDRNFLSK